MIPHQHGLTGLMTRIGLRVGLIAALASAPGTLPGQTGPALAGAALGTAGGAWVTLAAITAQARTGRYMFSTGDVGWKLVPVPLGTLTGAVLGYRDGDRLWRAAGYGVIGFASGSAVGAVLGRVAWRSPEGTWSGAFIGGALGLIAGSAIGALEERDNASGPTPLLAMSIPLGGR